jgi:hypothetical protein
LKNKEKILKWKRQYRVKNRDKINEYKHKRRRQESQFWHEGKLPNAANLAEKTIIGKVLPSLGFTDVFKPTKNLYFDALARKNGEIYAVEVTIHQRKTLKIYRRQFLEFFKLPLLVFFVKPDLTQCFLNEQNPMQYLTEYHYKQGERVQIC